MIHSDYYVYEHWRPDKNCCFYVGKGRRRRAWEMHHRNIRHRGTTSKLTALGLAIDIRIVARDMTHEAALAFEIEHIKKFDRSLLANMTGGGDGSRGHTHVVSAEARAKISAAHKGRVLTPERRAHLSAINRGKKHGPVAKAKLSAAFKGRVLTLEHRQKTSLGNKGKSKSEAHRAALKLGWLKRKAKGLGSHSAETRAKMSASHQRRLAVGGVK